MKKVKQSVTYNRSTCRYKAGVPWKKDRPTLPDNREAAVSRLRSTERKLEKDQFIEAEYRETIKTYIEKGYSVMSVSTSRLQQKCGISRTFR